MKYLKVLGLLAIAAIGLIALPAGATATGSVFCTVQESPCPEANRWAVGTTLDFSIPSGSRAVLKETGGGEILGCSGSTVKAKIEKAEGVTAPIESLTWSGCTFPVEAVTLGGLEIGNISGTHNGAVKSDGTIELIKYKVFGVPCIYGVFSGTSLGELKEGKPATLAVNAAVSRMVGSNSSCVETAILTSTYTLTEPKEKTLAVEPPPPPPPSVLCAVQKSPCPEASLWSAGTTLDFSLKAGTSAKLTNTAGTEVLDTCTESTGKGKIEKTENVTGPLESLTWAGCNFPTTTTLAGKLEVQNITGTHNGTVRADSETRVTVNGFFGSCLYGAATGADLGELKEGKPAALAVSAVVKKQSGSAAACPETAKWTAEYTLKEPGEKTLSVEEGVTASPSVLCAVQESPCPEANRWATGTELDFSLKSGASALLVDTNGSALDTCKTSTAKSKIEKAEAVTGPIESLTWGSCTFPTKTLTLGKLTIEHIAGTHNGTVKADSTTEVTINTILFGSCIYGAEPGVDLGELKEGKPATFVANAVLQKLGSNAACPETAKWTAEYTLTEPGEKTLSVETG